MGKISPCFYPLNALFNCFSFIYLSLCSLLSFLICISINLSACLFAFANPWSLSLPFPIHFCLCFPSGLCSWVCPITLISLIYTWTSAAVRYALSVCTAVGIFTHLLRRLTLVAVSSCSLLSAFLAQLRSAGAGVIQELFPRVSCVGTLDISDNGKGCLQTTYSMFKCCIHTFHIDVEVRFKGQFNA